MHNYMSYPHYPTKSAVKNAMFVGAIMGAAGATAHNLKQQQLDSSVMADILAGAVTGSLTTAGVIAVGEAVGMERSAASTAAMFVTATALLYALKKSS
jgi:uncharacterized membrane protein YoaK (UPF0700 family)